MPRCARCARAGRPAICTRIVPAARDEAELRPGEHDGGPCPLRPNAWRGGRAGGEATLEVIRNSTAMPEVHSARAAAAGSPRRQAAWRWGALAQGPVGRRGWSSRPPTSRSSAPHVHRLRVAEGADRAATRWCCAPRDSAAS
jgi:hypothetical protein